MHIIRVAPARQAKGDARKRLAEVTGPVYGIGTARHCGPVYRRDDHIFDEEYGCCIGRVGIGNILFKIGESIPVPIRHDLLKRTKVGHFPRIRNLVAIGIDG